MIVLQHIFTDGNMQEYNNTIPVQRYNKYCGINKLYIKFDKCTDY